MRPKLATLTALERLAGLARRLGLGALVDRIAPLVARPFERFELDVGGVRLGGASLAQLHYVRELLEEGRDRTFVRLLAEAIPAGGTVLEGGAHLGFVTIHAARAAGPKGAWSRSSRTRTCTRSCARTWLRTASPGACRSCRRRWEMRPERRASTSGRTRAAFSTSRADAEPVEVDVVRADEEVAGPVDVVKLDVEGSESAALRGMEGLLTGPAPPRALFLECNPPLLRRAGSSPEELVAWLRARSYDVEWIDESSGCAVALDTPWTEPYVNLRCTRVS